MATPTVPKAPVPPFAYPTEKAVYTMKFTGHVQRFSENRKVRQEHIDEARASVAGVSEWSNWLPSTTRDACEIDYRIKTGKDAYPKDPPVENITIALAPFRPKAKFDPEAHLQINGVVTWTGPLASQMGIRAAAEWRIGDRMAYYGIRSVSEKGWMYCVQPGIITVTPVPPEEKAEK